MCLQKALQHYKNLYSQIFFYANFFYACFLLKKDEDNSGNKGHRDA